MRRIGGELEIPIKIAIGDASLECVDELLHLQHRDDTLDLLARNEPQRRRSDHTEETISTDSVTKDLRVLRAAARHDLAVALHDLDRIEVANERRGGETSPVNVRSNRTADREAVGARLLLPDAPPCVPVTRTH